MPQFKKHRDTRVSTPSSWKKHRRGILLFILLMAFTIIVLQRVQSGINHLKDKDTLTHECTIYNGECTVDLPEQRQVHIKLKPALSHSGQLTNIAIQTNNIDIRSGNISIIRLSKNTVQTINAPLMPMSSHQIGNQLRFGQNDPNNSTWLMIVHLVAVDNSEYAIPFQYTVSGETRSLYNDVKK